MRVWLALCRKDGSVGRVECGKVNSGWVVGKASN